MLYELQTLTRFKSLMTMTKVRKNLIPYNKYYIDSAKFLIDDAVFDKVSIPNNFTLLDTDTGEVLDTFKKSSLLVEYKSHKIYIGRVVKILPKAVYNKILIYFPAKIRGNDYFYGIDKGTIIEVLEHLRTIGYLQFTDTNKVYKEIYVKDLDIKMDMQLSYKDKDKIKEYNDYLKNCFNGYSNCFYSYDNKINGLGIGTYKRETATISKPFLKFYDKSYEMKTKNYNLLISLNPELQFEIETNFIYRYEFTLKDKKFFDKFVLSSRLEELHEVSNDRWREIGRILLDKNFQVIVKKQRDTSKLKPIDTLLAMKFLKDIDKGISLREIQTEYISAASNKKQKYRMKLLFEKIHYTTMLEVEKLQPNIDKYDNFMKFHRLFGFID